MQVPWIEELLGSGTEETKEPGISDGDLEFYCSRNSGSTVVDDYRRPSQGEKLQLSGCS